MGEAAQLESQVTLSLHSQRVKKGKSMSNLRHDWHQKSKRPRLPVPALTLLLALFCSGCDVDLVDKRDQLQALNAVANGALLIDVRTPEEVAQGSFENAINIPHGEIVAGLGALNLDKKTPVVVFCRSGNRSGKAKAALDEAGYSLVINGGAYDDLRAVQRALEHKSGQQNPDSANEE